MAGALATLWIQYGRRRPALSRGILACSAGLCTLGFLAEPAGLAVAIQTRFPAVPANIAQIQPPLLRNPPGLASIVWDYGHRGSQFDVGPLRFPGLLAGAKVDLDRIDLTVGEPGNGSWQLGGARPKGSRTVNGDMLVDADLDPRDFSRLKSVPVNLRLSLASRCAYRM